MQLGRSEERSKNSYLQAPFSSNYFQAVLQCMLLVWGMLQFGVEASVPDTPQNACLEPYDLSVCSTERNCKLTCEITEVETCSCSLKNNQALVPSYLPGLGGLHNGLDL